MSQLLGQKRLKIGESDDDSECSSDDEDEETTSRAGFIRKLTLKNFMCHDFFELSFGPRMNFIIGRNGSGKSAVLTGIAVGLGAKATDTSRGSSIKSLIKDGKSTARIVVEIDNDGLDAYEPGTYGKVIIVERKLTREGTNVYYIKSENGTLVSNKKKTLDDILQKFFIVVNNPLSFLSQDKAREFIASSTEQSRFAYFSEGTNIQSIILNYQDASRNILSLQNRLIAAKEYYDESCQRYMECERAYKKYKHSHTLRQQLEKINGKIYWFNVDVLDRRIQKKDQEIAERTQEISDIDAQVEQNEAKSKTNTEELALLEKEKNLVAESLKSREQDLRQIEAKDAEVTKNVQGFRADLLNYKREIEDFAQQIKNHQLEIEAEQRKIDDINGGSRESMEQRLVLLKKRHETVVLSRDEIQEQLRKFNQVSPEMAALNKELEEQKTIKASLQDKLRSFERTKNDQYAAFGHNIGYLMRDIERELSWHQKPIGPVGCHIAVKAEYTQYSEAINTFLLKTLDSFVVCDEHDRRLLNQLMRSKKIFKNIIVRKFEKFQYNTDISSRFTTVLDILDIQAEDVKFTLIDSSGVEEIVVCETVAEAEEVTRANGVKQAVCLSDRRSGIRLSRRDGRLNRDPIYYSRDLKKLAGKVTSDSIMDELQEVSNEEAKIQQKRNSLRAAEFEAKKKLQKELEERKKHLQEINNQIYTTEQSLLDEGDSGRIESLKNQIELCENQIKTREGMSVELLQNLNEAKKALSVVKKEVQEKSSAKQALDQELVELDRKIDQLTEAAQVQRAETEGLQNRRKEVESDIEKRTAKKAADQEKREELRAVAQERCDRSEVDIRESDTTESITAEFRSIQEAIEEAEKNNSKSFEDIQNEVLESKALKDKCEQSLSEVDNARITLENDLNSRFENLNITIKEKLTRAKLSFEQSLALRGFKGKLEFDFGRKRVITEVQTKDDKGTRSVLSLSGGEKSFTQIAFLLSIWKVMKPRVCGLDEFDVFMDSVNRTIAIRLLIHELRNSIAQSIFITPQDIAVVGDLNDGEDVRIHRIRPPRND